MIAFSRAQPVCPVCEEEIEDGDGTFEGDELYHYPCCPDDGAHEE